MGCFSVSDSNMSKLAISFNSPQNGFESFGWRLQIKSFYSPQTLLNWNFLLKTYNVLQLQRFIYAPSLAATQGKRCLLMCQKSQETGSWHLNLIIICNLPKWAHRKGHGCNMSTWCYIIYLFMQIYALIFLCTCVKERKASSKFLD